MNKDEIDAFIANPGPDGLYRFTHNQYIRYRKYFDNIWHNGWDEDDFRDIEAVKTKCFNETKDDNGMSHKWLTEGASVEFFCDMNGNRPAVRVEPEQMDIFDV